MDINVGTLEHERCRIYVVEIIVAKNRKRHGQDL